MNNLDKFMEVYTRRLAEALMNEPHNYVWPASELPTVLAKMRNAFIRKSFNKDGYAIKMTCRELKIKHTYRDIETFLGYTEVKQ